MLSKKKPGNEIVIFYKRLLSILQILSLKGKTATLKYKKACIITGLGCLYSIVSLSVMAAMHF